MLPRPSYSLLRRHLTTHAPAPHPSDLWISKALATCFLLRGPSFPFPFPPLTPLVASLALARIHTLRKHQHSSALLSFFLFTRDRLLIPHTPASHTLLIHSLSRAGHMPRALRLFDQLLAACPAYTPDEPLLGSLIESCVASALLDSALLLISRAQHFRLRLGPSRYNNVMTALIHSNRPTDALLLFKHHLASNSFSPDLWTFNIALKALCTLGDVQGALRLLDQMRQLGYSPDTVTHNTLVNGLCKANQVDQAYHLFKRIHSDGLGMPNVITYTTVITAYCKAGEMRKAREVFDEMLHSGVKPNRITYNVLIDGYAKNGHMHLACTIYDSMILGGCPADIITVTSLINGYCINNRFDDAMRLWNQMGLKALRPNVYTFSVMIHHLCKLNRLEEARRFLAQLTSRNDIVPKAFVYNPLLDALCRIGNVDEAKNILHHMEKRNGYPDKYTYTILIIGHCMKGRMEEAVSLFYKMCDTGCNPDAIATRSLVTCLLKAGLPDQASLIMSRSNSDTFSVKDDHLALLRKTPQVSVAV